MKTILWATLTANGNYAAASAEHPPKPETLADFAARAKHAGNFIAGSRTFKSFQTDSSRKTSDAEQAFAGIEPIVISNSEDEIPGVKTFSSPKSALNYLESKGYETALLAGGETLHNSFLEQNLVDELIFNIAPVFESAGMNLVLPKGAYKQLKLLNFTELGGGVVQLHYRIER